MIEYLISPAIKAAEWLREWHTKRAMSRPDPLISTAQALQYVLEESRAGRRLQGDTAGLLAIDMIEEALRSGALAASGRRRHQAVYEPIERHYWLTAQLDRVDHLMADHSQSKTEPREELVDLPVYEGVMVSARAVRRLWRPPLRLFG